MVLVLQSEGLVRIRINPVFRFQAAPGIVFAHPQQIAKLVGLFSGQADLVGVVIAQIQLLVFVVVKDMAKGS